jgi:drug/metabolite transporter (DMT)-like permease
VTRLPAGVASALGAALLFGASTPIAKRLVGDIAPQMLAGLLYLGSGLGLALVFAWRALGRRDAAARVALPRGAEWGWLGGAILAGGVVGPVLLMIALTGTSASTASLLLNLEGVFTALLAWFVFRENFDRRIALGMAAIVAGGVVLAWQPAGSSASPWGPLAVAAACACWALDNNLTRKVAANDALAIACAKGLVAGFVNVGIALALGQSIGHAAAAVTAGVVGFLGYGVSLVLFVIALRHLGTARTGGYFSVAPFCGALLAIAFLGEAVTAALALGGALMALGVWLHVTEHHEHDHEHEPMEHEHAHVHDEHHRHEHPGGWDGREPHTHRHVHARLRHRHAHYPDIHHQHRH